MVELLRIKLSDIDRCDDSRMIDPKWVSAIAEGIASGDMPSPIDVIDQGGRYRQITGQHRFEAHLTTKAKDIECRVYQPDDFPDDGAVKLHQIKENLMQRQLSALDRALAWSEWKSVYEAHNPTHMHGGRRTPSTEDDQVALFATCFSDMAAEALGVSVRTIYNSIKIAGTLSPEVIERISLRPLADKQSELLALASSGHDVQLKIIDLIFDDQCPAQSVADALQLLEKGKLKAKPDAVMATYETLARWTAKQRHTLYELNEAEIREWLNSRDGSVKNGGAK